jgi:MerR family redox-sensitive transcriptional activator SoxR
LTLEEIGRTLSALPTDRTPVKRDWERVSRAWRNRLDERIVELERLRDTADSCIGCGASRCGRCSLLNGADRISMNGSGARYLLGDVSDGLTLEASSARAIEQPGVAHSLDLARSEFA